MAGTELASTAKALVAAGKGILAADESTGTIKRRLDSIGVESTEDNRRAYRELLFTTPGAEQYISGVILYDETLRQSSSDGTPFPKLLHGKGIIPGIKVDMGAKPLAFHPGETVTEGLDGLRERLEEYYGLGARFAKWRAVIDIGDGTPTASAIAANAHALARYAALCLEQNIVPIVEPEVLMDGGHTIERCEEVTTAVLNAVYDELYAARVALEGTLLKPNMVISGNKCGTQASAQQVAEATVRVLRSTVPSAVPGVVFLSGGQSPAQATENLNAMNAMGPHPWALSFSYGRALQDEALKTWRGAADNVAKAQQMFAGRSKLTSAATNGSYTPALEKELVGA